MVIMAKLFRFVHSMSVCMPVHAKNKPANAKKKPHISAAATQDRTVLRTSDVSLAIMEELSDAYFDIYIVAMAIVGLWAVLVGLHEASVALGVWGMWTFLMVGFFKAKYKYCFPPKYDALMVISNVILMWFSVPLHFEYLFGALVFVHGAFSVMALFTMPPTSRCSLLKRSFSKRGSEHEPLPSGGFSPPKSSNVGPQNSSDTDEEFA